MTAERARAGFVAAFGVAPDGIVRAPGRVNLIGEHTDYNDGFVLPCALEFATWVAFRRRDDGQVRVVACDFDSAQDAFPVAKPERVAPEGDWRNYVRGTIAALDDLPLTGVDLAIAGDIPRGCGLSSSASLEVAVALAATSASGSSATPIRLALAGQRAEHDFAGVRCGIMDQLVSAAAVAGAALLIDCRSLACTPIAMADEIAVLVVQSGIARGLVDGHYNARRSECVEAAAALGVPALRDATLDDLERARPRMSDTAYRRARHVVSENERVIAFAAALAATDWPAIGALMALSHRSMRDDFEITVPGIDRLVAIADTAIATEADGRGGARMTGGGFGGAIVVVVPAARADAVAARIAADYPGCAPLRVAPAAGALVFRA